MNIYTKLSLVLLLLAVSIAAIQLEPTHITGAFSIQSDTILPTITNIQYSSSLNQGQTQTISADITDDVNISTVLFEISNSNITKTSSNSTYTHSYTPAVGQNSVKIHAKDTSNNWNSTSISFTVNDTEVPSISASFTDPLSSSSAQIITATVTDNVNISQVLLELSGTNITLNSSTSTYSHSYSPSSLGINNFKIHAKDTSNNSNSESYSFTLSEYLTSNSTIENSTITPDSEIIDSIIRNSIINSSSILSSTVENMTVKNANIITDFLHTGTIIHQSTTYNTPLPLSTIYQGDYYCGDGTCDSTESCYTCATDCGSCGYQTTIIDDLSAGAKLTQLFEAIGAGKDIEVMTDNADFPVTKVSLRVTEAVNSAKLELIKNTTESNNTVYKYFQIETTNLTSSNTDNIQIFFRVTKNWISNHEWSNENIMLQKYVDDEWTNKTTSYLSEDDTYYNYRAELESFSNFRIIASSDTQTSSEESSATQDYYCGDGYIGVDETQENCCSDVPCDPGFTCQANTCIPNLCGNGICDPDENPGTCSVDCPAVCGDAICEFNEDSTTCPDDCPNIEPDILETSLETLESTNEESLNTTASGFAIADGACEGELCKFVKSNNFKYTLAGIVIISLATLFALLQLGYIKLPLDQPRRPATAGRQRIQKTSGQPPQQLPVQQVPQELEQYINLCIQQRIHPGQIKQILANSGWQPEIIDYILRMKRYI